MVVYEEVLFNYIKEKLPSNISFIDEIADVLDINYDAAYRRIKGKTSLTLKESILLSKHYNFNLNNIYEDDEVASDKIIVEKTHHVLSKDILDKFFDKSIEEIDLILKAKNGKLTTAVKDLPLYHCDNSYIKSFRIFVLNNMLSKNPDIKKIPFAKFSPSKSALDKYEKFLNNFQKASLVEIWNDTTIDNILSQIAYFFEVGLITKEETTLIANGLTESLKSIEEQAKNKKRKYSNNSFYLYHNNIFSLFNTVLIEHSKESIVYVPYTHLTYFKVLDNDTNLQLQNYLKTQIEFSTDLTGDASVERRKFFNAMYQKIENRMFKLLL